MAGKRKINDDNIRVNLDLNASDAEKNIHRLTQATKELKAQNAAHRKEISALAATEGDHSKEIAGLNELIKANSRAIRQNDKDIARWEKEIDITYKTTAQLKKHLKGLNKELDNTSRSLHPQEYEKLRKEIEETQKALDVANGKTEGLKRSFMSLAGMKEVVTAFFSQSELPCSLLLPASSKRLYRPLLTLRKLTANWRLCSAQPKPESET